MGKLIYILNGYVGMMWWESNNTAWRLREKKNGKKREILSISKISDGMPPILPVPFIYQGTSDILIDGLKDKSIDLILTDPPYGITQNRWDEKPVWASLAKRYNRILKDNGLIAIFGTVPNIIDVYNSFQDFFDFRFDIIWVKGSATAMWVSNYKPLRTHENIYVFSKKDVDLSKTTFNVKMMGERGKAYTIKRTVTTTNQGNWKNIKFVSKSDGLRFPVSVPAIEIGGIGGVDKEYLKVPTQKPEKLIEFFIRGLTNPSDTVCDPYLGSGTTAKVAMENARLCIGAELDPKMYPIIKKRLKQVKNHYAGKNIRWKYTNGFLKESLKNMMMEK